MCTWNAPEVSCECGLGWQGNGFECHREATALELFNCPLNGRLYQNDIGDAIVGISRVQCAHTCAVHANCTSFDYSVTGQKCQLGDGVVGVDGELHHVGYYHYYQKNIVNP